MGGGGAGTNPMKATVVAVAARSSRSRTRAARVRLSVYYWALGHAGGMAVLGAGYEVEGRAMTRLVLETRARLLEVTEDASQEARRCWLKREPQRNMTEVIQAKRGTTPTLMWAGSCDLWRLQVGVRFAGG